MSELSATYADDSNVTSWTCTLPKGGNTVVLTLTPSSGAISMSASTVTISGMQVSCSISGNEVTCNPL